MITVTEQAQNQILRQLEQNPDSVGIKLYVRSTGCSGYVYKIDLISEAELRDTEILFDKFSIFIDYETKQYFDNVTLDWEKTQFEERFVFINPDEKARCGCGESFLI